MTLLWIQVLWEPVDTEQTWWPPYIFVVQLEVQVQNDKSMIRMQLVKN